MARKALIKGGHIEYFYYDREPEMWGVTSHADGNWSKCGWKKCICVINQPFSQRRTYSTKICHLDAFSMYARYFITISAPFIVENVTHVVRP